MARTGVTYNEVTAAIDKIIASGEGVTIMGIREVLGTGSPNTIHRHLKAWKSAQPPAKVRVVELPPALADALTQELARQVSEARAEIKDELQRALDDADYLSSDGEKRDADIEDLREQLAVKDNDLGNLKADFDRVNDSLARTQNDLSAERALVNEMRDEIALTKNRVITLSEHVDHLKSELTVAKTDLKSAHDAQVQAEKAGAVAAAKLEAEQNKNSDLLSRLDAANDTIASLKADNKSELEALKAELKSLRESLETERKESIKSRAKYDSDCQKLNEHLSLEHRKNAELQSEIDSLNDKLTQTKQSKISKN